MSKNVTAAAEQGSADQPETDISDIPRGNGAIEGSVGTIACKGVKPWKAKRAQRARDTGGNSTNFPKTN